MLSAARFALLSALLSVIPAASAQDSKENSEFKLAVGLYNDGMYDLAVEQLKNFVNAYPSTSQGIEARFFLGEAQLKLRRFDEARITLQNFALAYTEHPKAPESWILTGEAYLGLKNEREAASAFERVRVFHPKSTLVPEALFRAGELETKLGDRDLAAKNFRTILQDYPSSSSVLPAHLAMGEIYTAAGETELAEKEVRKVAESDGPPEVKARALITLGRLEASSSLFAAAESTFSGVLSRYKKSSAAIPASYELGRLEFGARNYAAAIDHFKACLGDTLMPYAQLGIGRAYQRQRDYINAQRAYEKSAEGTAPTAVMAEAELGAGTSALLRGDFVAALRHAKKLQNLPAADLKGEALHLAGRASVGAGQYEAGAQYLSEFAEKYPDDVRSLHVMLDVGHLYQEKLRDFRKAIGVYDRIVGKNPRSGEAIAALIGTAECQQAIRDFEGALKTLENLQSRYPAHDQFANIQMKIEFIQKHTVKDRDSGTAKLARLIGEIFTQKTKPELALSLAEIYFNDLKDYEVAAAQYSLAIEGGIDERRAADAAYKRARSLELFSEVDTSSTSRALSAYDSFVTKYTASHSGDVQMGIYRLKSRNADPAARILLAKKVLEGGAREDVLMDLGMAAEATGDMVTAANSFREVAQYSQSAYTNRALYELGKIQIHAKNSDSAAAEWRRVLGRSLIDPATVSAASDLAELEWNQKHYPEAIALWERMRGDFPYTAAAGRAEVELPEAYVANGQYDDAIASVGSDTSDRAKIVLAAAYEKKGDRKKAISYYRSYLREDRKGPYASGAFYALGTIARAEGRKDLASTYFREAALLGGMEGVTRDIADLLFQTEQYGDAARQYSGLADRADSSELKTYFRVRAIVAMLRADKLADASKYSDETGVEDRTGEILYETGNYHYRRQDYVPAKKAFEKLASDYRDQRYGPWGEYFLGKIAEVTGKLDEAADRYDRVLEKHPTSDVIPRVQLSLGNMHFNAERFDRAIKYYQQISDNPGQAGDILPYAMNNLIEAYESLNLYDAALKTVRDYIEKYPADETIIDKKIKLGTLYTKVSYYDQAVLQFQNLLNEAGSGLEAEIRYDIGEAYYYKGDYRQAILEFLKVPYLVAKQGKVNWTATSLYMAGQAYEKMSKFEEAIGMYQQVIDRPGIDATFKAAAKKEIDRVRTIIKKG